MLVARACLCAGRLKSALFYAELYGESRFGGSTLALEAIARSFTGLQEGSPRVVGTDDISGFGFSTVDKSKFANFETKAESEEGHTFLTVLRDCYSELEERDAREAAQGSITDLSIVCPQDTGLSISSLPYLGMLDNSAQSGRHRGRSVGAIADTLENLGLRFTLGSYIAGLTTQYQDVLADLSLDELRDNWFKCRLFSMQWEDTVFEGNENTVVRHAGLPRVEVQHSSGFHAVLFEVITAMQNDDY